MKKAQDVLKTFIYFFQMRYILRFSKGKCTTNRTEAGLHKGCVGLVNLYFGPFLK